MQCAVHGIAGGPDGLCALCHSVQKAHARREGARLGWILFLVLGTATGSLLAIHEFAPFPGQKARLVRAEPAPAPARPAAEVPEPDPDPSPPATPTPLAATTPTALRPHSVPLPEVEAAPGPSAAPSATAALTAPPASPPPRTLSDKELRAALVATPISMYTAPWCGTCRRAHEFFQQNGLPVKDLNVDDNPTALRELKSRSGGTAIPVIDVDGKLLRAGFNARAIAEALTESVERRFGARGVQVQATR